MLENAKIIEVVNEAYIGNYYTHEAEISNIKFDETKQTLTFKLNFDGWIKEQHEEDGLFFTSLDIMFQGVKELNVSGEKPVVYKFNKTTISNPMAEHEIFSEAEELDIDIPLKSITETLLGIYRDGNVISILVDVDFAKTIIIKFLAETVDVTEVL